MKYIGYTQDTDTAVNCSYFVHLNGVAAATYNSFITSQEFLPAQTIPNVPTFMINDRNHRVANSGYLIQANMILKCLRNSRGGYRCPNTRYVHVKVCYIKPQIFNPLILNHYLPTGEIAISAAYDHPRPDREIEVPVNMVRMQDISIQPPIIAAPNFQGHDHHGHPGPDAPGPSQAHANHAPVAAQQAGQGPPFQIYRDDQDENVNQSSSSTVSLPQSEASSNVIAGNLQRQPSQIQSRESSFNPTTTSTRSPRGSGQDLYLNPQPGPSHADPSLPNESGFIIDNVRSLRKKTPRKSPRKSPRKDGLTRTPSQPAITNFTKSVKKTTIKTPKRKNRPSPTPSPSSSRPSKVKRILSDLTQEEREEAAALERSLMKNDSSIKEATLDLSTLPPPTNLLTPPESQSSSTQGSSIPSMSEVNTSGDVSLSQIQPSEFSSSVEERGSSAGTSNEFNPQEVEGNDRIIAVRDPVSGHDDTPIVFDVANAVVARGSLAGDPSPDNAPDLPEHVLIVVEDPDVITHVINFSSRHQPEAILEAFWSNSLNLTLPDEGIENTAEVTPTAPPPTPTSSTEAMQGSSDTPQLSNDSVPEITLDSSSDTSILCINANVNDELDSKGDEETKEEETEEEGRRGI